MSYISNSNTIHIGITQLKFIGEDIEHTSVMTLFLRALTLTMITIVVLSASANILNVDGDMYMSILQSAAIALHVSKLLI